MTQIQNTDEYIISDDLEEQVKSGFWHKIARFLESSYFLVAVVIFVSFISFFLGRISGLEDKRPPVRVISENGGEVLGASTEISKDNPPNPPYIKGGTEEKTVTQQQTPSSQNNSGGQVVASKNGTKYHYPWCAGAKQISDKNKITFNSIEEARAKGYTPAANCKGLK